MMAEDCSVLDPWLYHSESAWMSEAFARDNEALTRALQISLSDTSSSGGATTSTPPPSPPLLLPFPPPPEPPARPLCRAHPAAEPAARPCLRGTRRQAQVARLEAVAHDLHQRRPGQLPGDGAARHRHPGGRESAARFRRVGQAGADPGRAGLPRGPAAALPAHARHLGALAGQRRRFARCVVGIPGFRRRRGILAGLPHPRVVGNHVTDWGLAINHVLDVVLGDQ
ncbi:hypothetical protein ZIOFF_041863 [Zingiber officinale]|uniref:Uncharacterized protein n=1 Tax=Zingiber officinale TaxID=94328 RepID=A0A8J5G991_ZINOF|nr:hypothetical protein ZIOFF_041863 [Zingiber officinale]